MNYSELKTLIADHLDRSDLSAHIDSFIDLAESRMNRDIRIREMLTRATLSVDSRYAPLPDDFLEMKTMRILTDPVTVLTELSLQDMNKVRSESTGKPSYFTITSEIEFDKSPSDAYTVEMIYYASLTPLDEDNTSNVILEKAMDVYLYACLIAAEPFLMNDERIATWATFYTTGKDALNGMARKRSGSVSARAHGPTP